MHFGRPEIAIHKLRLTFRASLGFLERVGIKKVLGGHIHHAQSSCVTKKKTHLGFFIKGRRNCYPRDRITRALIERSENYALSQNFARIVRQTYGLLIRIDQNSFLLMGRGMAPIDMQLHGNPLGVG